MSKLYFYFYNEQNKLEKISKIRNEKHATDYLNLFRKLNFFRKFGYNVELKIR